MKTLLESRGDSPAVTSGSGATPTALPGGATVAEPPSAPADEGSPAPTPGATAPKVTIRVTGVPGSQARDVVKVAVLPLSAASSDVTLELIIRADGGLAGIPRETLNLVVLEGLRQLGLHDVEVEES